MKRFVDIINSAGSDIDLYRILSNISGHITELRITLPLPVPRGSYYNSEEYYTFLVIGKLYHENGEPCSKIDCGFIKKYLESINCLKKMVHDQGSTFDNDLKTMVRSSRLMFDEDFDFYRHRFDRDFEDSRHIFDRNFIYMFYKMIRKFTLIYVDLDTALYNR